MTTVTPRITLSFDNGPEPEVTPGVLDVLRRRGLRATFFVLGHKLADPQRHALAHRAHDDGHWIGNHTYSHARPLGECAGEPGHAEAEIGRTQALLGNLSHPDKLFRPFGDGGLLGPHLLSEEAKDHLIDGHHTCITWNAVPGDWHDIDGWPERALTQCRAVPHALLVLHDLPSGAMRHLDRFLGTAADHGASFQQDFPDDCVLIRRGVAAASIDRFVSGPSAASDTATCVTH